MVQALVCAAELGLAHDRAAAARAPVYPPLRLSGPAAASRPEGLPGPQARAGAGADKASFRPVVPDERWCGIEVTRPATAAPLPCKHPGLPCGPVQAPDISSGAGEVGEDLDGDGTPDLTLAGRRLLPKPESYAAIYRATPRGYVLSDYQGLLARAEPSAATVVLAAPGSPPLVRDGFDIVDPGGRTVTIARLRRFDGQRFRTLLTFCSHRAEPLFGQPGASGLREGHNRLEIVDIDKDGQKEVVIGGLIQPTAFHFDAGGLALVPDPSLSNIYRENSTETQRSRTLRGEAGRLLEGGQVKRAAETLSRAQMAMPHDTGLSLELAGLLVRSGQPDKALEVLGRLRFRAPDQAGVYCGLGRAYRALGDAASERTALRTCLTKEPDEALASEAAARLRELPQ